MKKVLIISSTPRHGGNSDVLCDAFLRGAEAAGHEVEKVFLADFQVNYCKGCDYCSINNAPCPQKDDAWPIIKKMIEADVIVMGTPVYFYTMSAQMKTLIDRVCPYYTEVLDKEFYFILTAADTDKAMLERTMESFRGFLECLDGPEEKGVLYGVGLWHKGEAKDSPYIQEAYAMGKGV